ncbi:MAG: peptidase C26 [Gemmataceae bacterium]
MPLPHHLRPVIGITCDYIPPGKQNGAVHRLHAGYAEAVHAAGGVPLIIPPVFKEKEAEDLLDRLDGLLLAGSLFDVDPKRLGLPPHPAVHAMPPRRAELDLLWCKLVLQRRIPVLAVSTSMLQLNALAGGTLYMHLPEEMPRSLSHRDPGGGPHRHLILIEPGTHLERIYGTPEHLVNSYHHQGIRELASLFRVCARAPDGLIEAFEAEDAQWFCLGVQWHPYSETASALDKQLFDAFVAACGRQEAVLPMAA